MGTNGVYLPCQFKCSKYPVFSLVYLHFHTRLLQFNAHVGRQRHPCIVAHVDFHADSFKESAKRAALEIRVRKVPSEKTDKKDDAADKGLVLLVGHRVPVTMWTEASIRTAPSRMWRA